MMNDLISKKKLLKDLGGMYDVLTGAGDPFLASMIRKAMECVERQPAAEVQHPVANDRCRKATEEAITDNRYWKALLQLEREYNKRKNESRVRDPLAFALYQIWKQVDEGAL